MAKRKIVKIKKWKVIVSIIVLCLLAVTHIFADKLQVLVGYDTSLASNQTTKDKIENSDYYVSYIDVGQGNSSFVKFPDGKTMLIDGGDKEFGETVEKFLDDRNITQIDYLVATHSDSDHIAGLNYVIENFEFKTIYRPFQISMQKIEGSNPAQYEVYEYEDLSEVYEEITNLTGADNKRINKVTTKVYRDFIKNIYEETYTLEGSSVETNVCVFYDGLKISGENYEVEFFAPLRHNETFDLSEYPGETSGYATMGYTDANDSSAIFTISCFDDKFLFMGDSRFTESSLSDRDHSEWDFLQSLTTTEKEKLAEVDVLMLPHHGSRYSTCDELLDIVLPRYVIVSAGADNKYGHPHDEVLDRLKGLSSLEDDYLLRTDTMGDIVFSSVDSKLGYYTEKQATHENLKLSFRMLTAIIGVIIIMLIFSIRPRKRKKSRAYSYQK